MLNIGCALLAEGYFSIGTDQQGNCARATSAAGGAILIDGQISGNNNTIPAIPVGRRNPVESVDKRIGASVASVDAGYT
jgi:hypothetical protein